MRFIKISIVYLFFALFALPCFSLTEDSASIAGDSIINSIKSTFNKAKNYVSTQYYNQSIKHIMTMQEDDYEAYLEKYNNASMWKKIWWFFKKNKAVKVNQNIINSGEKCLSLLKEDSSKDEFKQEYNHFLGLRNYFIAHFYYSNGH